MRRRLMQLAAGAAGLGAVGFLVAASGVVPIKASSGHWPVTAWFLHFSMERSVATHSLGIEPPPGLDDPALVLQGAGHFEGGCRPCHGGWGPRDPRLPRAMTPHPPSLLPRIGEWAPEELFYIVKHGVKFTGMPAWPALEREDEVWAVVAFLLTLPELTAEEYHRLVFGEVPRDAVPDLEDLPDSEVASEPPPRAVTESCGRCHGIDGRGRGAGAFPRLAGQRPAYLAAALTAYAEGRRPSGIMEPVAAALTDEVIAALARYYGDLPAAGPVAGGSWDRDAVERGRAIAERGIPGRRVPSCTDCHGPASGPKNPHYPLLAGQYPRYLVSQLALFGKGHRGGSPYAGLMDPTAHRLSPEERRDVAAYYGSLAGESR